MVDIDWDEAASTFDLQPDHGLLDADVRRSWWRLLEVHLSPAARQVVDVGCGTGSLSVLLAEQGHAVCGVDRSGQMLAQARTKAMAAAVPVQFVRGDAADPPFRRAAADVIVCRHVLWALDDVDLALRRWARLLRPDGVLLLIEGHWSTGAGMPASDVVDALQRLGRSASVDALPDERLWGGPIDDERYIVRSEA